VPTNQTQLAKNNAGENPRSEKMQTTDGRAEVKIHLQIEEYPMHQINI
jgi:hypothetical protein